MPSLAEIITLGAVRATTRLMGEGLSGLGLVNALRRRFPGLSSSLAGELIRTVRGSQERLGDLAGRDPSVRLGTGAAITVQGDFPRGARYLYQVHVTIRSPATGELHDRTVIVPSGRLLTGGELDRIARTSTLVSESTVPGGVGGGVAVQVVSVEVESLVRSF